MVVAVAVVAAVVVVVVVPEVQHQPGRHRSRPGRQARRPPVAVPFTLVAVSPANTATAVPTDATVSVQFSTPLASGSPQPTLSPPVAGSWQLLTPTTVHLRGHRALRALAPPRR